MAFAADCATGGGDDESGNNNFDSEVESESSQMRNWAKMASLSVDTSHDHTHQCDRAAIIDARQTAKEAAELYDRQMQWERDTHTHSASRGSDIENDSDRNVNVSATSPYAEWEMKAQSDYDEIYGEGGEGWANKDQTRNKTEQNQKKTKNDH
jgi:hypothetical protein